MKRILPGCIHNIAVDVISCEMCFQVIIQGFRSYRDQTVVDPFSSKHNVIGKTLLILACDISFIAEIGKIGKSINKYKETIT